MKDVIANVLKSFNGNNLDGYSSRKLTAFIIVVVVIITHIKWLTLGNLSQLETVLTIDYTFIAALFGMTTYQSIKATPKSTTSSESTSTSTTDSGDTMKEINKSESETNK